jgi:hypothetical protein
MNIKKCIIIIIMLITVQFLSIQVAAHPPSNIELTYTIENNVLDATIYHQVSNPNDHYIYKVEIWKNDELIITENYNNQPDNSVFTYSYIIDSSQGGDVLELKATCSITGSYTEEIIIPTDGNNPPTIPTINGETNGEAGMSYNYVVKSIDPEGDQISYCIDWGDGTPELCNGPYESGIEQTYSHSWSEQDTYTIRIKARDINGAESEWGSLEVKMPINKININILFFKFLEFQKDILLFLRNIVNF